LPSAWLLSVSYLGNETTHLWSGGGEMNPAFYIPGNCVAGQDGLTKPGPCSTTSNTNFRRRLYLANPVLGAGYASINTMDDGAVAHYNGLLASIQHRFANNYTFLANYTDSQCLSDADFGAALAASTNSQPFNRHADFGPCVFDTRHIFNLSLVAQSKFKGANKWVNMLLSDWELAPLVHATSGQPINVTLGTDVSLTGLGNDRPTVFTGTKATNPICNNGSTPCVQWLNNSTTLGSEAFQTAGQTALGTYGDLGRNALRGPDFVNVDVALSRSFRIKERYRVQARVDTFNLMNHANFVGAISPAGTVTAYSTMTTTMSSSSFGRVNAAFDPRIFQFSLKMFF